MVAAQWLLVPSIEQGCYSSRPAPCRVARALAHKEWVGFSCVRAYIHTYLHPDSTLPSSIHMVISGTFMTCQADNASSAGTNDRKLIKLFSVATYRGLPLVLVQVLLHGTELSCVVDHQQRPKNEILRRFTQRNDFFIKGLMQWLQTRRQEGCGVKAKKNGPVDTCVKRMSYGWASMGAIFPLPDPGPFPALLPDPAGAGLLLLGAGPRSCVFAWQLRAPAPISATASRSRTPLPRSPMPRGRPGCTRARRTSRATPIGIPLGVQPAARLRAPRLSALNTNFPTQFQFVDAKDLAGG